MLRPLVRRGEARLTVPALGGLAFIGAWLSHTLEDARLEGVTGLQRLVLDQVHAHMLPLGGLIAALAAVGGAGCRHAWQTLGA